ncbi:hypothetical protein ACH6EH_18130, partial [Paenibacillus sp. JSM ZJ436]|uniref:hypothetical protein n=1 Tax=Paenibacillus sp. JSM ZJ436 TaxID=3376190 RepID=UPI0037894DF9
TKELNSSVPSFPLYQILKKLSDLSDPMNLQNSVLATQFSEEPKYNARLYFKMSSAIINSVAKFLTEYAPVVQWI